VTYRDDRGYRTGGMDSRDRDIRNTSVQEMARYDILAFAYFPSVLSPKWSALVSDLDVSFVISAVPLTETPKWHIGS